MLTQVENKWLQTSSKVRKANVIFDTKEKGFLILTQTRNYKVNVKKLPIAIMQYILDAVRLLGILKAKQKLGLTFNFDKQNVIDFTKLSQMTMCRASKANSEK